MITNKPLTTIEDFKALKKGDFVACEFYRDIHDYPNEYRFKVFAIEKVRTDTKEVILQIKNNVYFNYEMYLNGESNCKNAVLISHD